MLSPRGQTFVLFYDDRFNLLKMKQYSSNIIPLWCEGSKIYFFGVVYGLGAKEDFVEVGNVVEYKNGLDEGYLMFEYNYGSSGGVDSLYWEVKDKQIIQNGAVK